MTNVVRCGVDSAGGGVVIANTVRTVFVNGSPIGCDFDSITSHGQNEHAAAVITTGSPTVFANGQPVATISSLTSCGHPIIPGSPNVFISTF